MKPYYLLLNQEAKGPYTLHQLRSMWNAGAITMETRFRQDGSDDWRPLSFILPDLEPPAPGTAAPTAPVPAQPAGQAAAENTVWEGGPSHWHYFWLWFFGILLLPAFGAGLIFLAIIYYERASRRYTVTSRKVVFESGFFVKSTNEVRIRDIRSINVSKSGIAGFIGIGNVEFSSAASDESEIIFRGVAEANKIRDIVRNLQDGVETATR